MRDIIIEIISESKEIRMTTPASIVGVWKLISFVSDLGDGQITYPYGEDARGTIIYSDVGQFSAQIMRLGRPKFAAGDHREANQEVIIARPKVREENQMSFVT
jgi:lipocalin-like protein